MYLTKSAKTELKQITALWTVTNDNTGVEQTVYAPSQLQAIGKLFPGGSRVLECPLACRAPEGASYYTVTVFPSSKIGVETNYTIEVKPVLAIV